MGCRDRYDEPDPEVVRAIAADDLRRKLIRLPASSFTVEELQLLMKVNWSEWKTRYYPHEVEEIERLAEKHLGKAD